MSRRILVRFVAALALLAGVLTLVGGPPASAETGTKALVLGSSTSGGASSPEALRAAALGFTVTVVDDATWNAMTAAQFADYQLIIIGDTGNGSVPAASQNAVALTDAVMARAGGNTKAGNRVLIGTDPVAHFSQGGDALVDSAVAFAGAVDGATNLYLTISDFDGDFDSNGTPDILDKVLPRLTIDPTPNWTMNENPPCGGSVSLISNAAQFSTLTSADLQGWGCSDHETYPTYPTDWSPLAVATDTPTAPTCGTDVDTNAAVCGEAYLLIAGTGITSTAPNLALTPATQPVVTGSPVTVTATVTNNDATPRPGVPVSFLVTGANAGAAGTCVPASCVTDASGEVDFTYTGTVDGVDTVNASITIDGSTQSVTANVNHTDVTPVPEDCGNGIDDDGDLLVDSDDPDCASPPERLCEGKAATIVGTNGPDTIVGTDGDDVIVGRQGNDTIYGRGGNDTICGGGGNDTVYGGNGDDVINGNRGNDLLHGNKGADRIAGQQDDDDVQGDQGADRLAGNDGDDRIAGGEDVDACDGGPGTNVLVTCP